MKRYLIINADDYGLCYAANEAIERLFNHGFITTTTLMTPCPWGEDAIHRALKNPKMTVGLHITTTNEYDCYKWGPIDRSCLSLMDNRGYLYLTAQQSLQHASAEDMSKEISAQYDWMMERGLPPEHVDSHMGTVYGIAGPSHLEAVYQLCAEHKLNFRLPQMPETIFPNVTDEIKAMVRFAVQAGQSLGIGMPKGLFTYDYDLQSDDTYDKFKGYYLDMIERCPEGVSELFLHPCIETAPLKSINAHWQKRVWEYQLMLDDEVLRFIQNQDIELVTYSDAPF